MVVSVLPYSGKLSRVAIFADVGFRSFFFTF